ncbi:hypothetical protein K439DRAFT_922986 [Ramaria rubella]|nr:hypothetical protein K439DRAFT_922986 [Ramaria rubella]
MFPNQHLDIRPHFRHPHDDLPVYPSYPALASSSGYETAALDPHDRNYYPSHYQENYPDAYPQPCVQQEYPPQLHIHTNFPPRYPESHSPYASASVSASTAYHPLTPPPNELESALHAHPHYVYESQGDRSPALQPKYLADHSDASASWQQSDPVEGTQESPSHVGVQQIGTDARGGRCDLIDPHTANPATHLIPNSQQWAPAYDDELRYPSPEPHYSGPHAGTEHEQLPSSDDVPYPELESYPHAPQYGGSAIHRGVYDHAAQDSPFSSQDVHEASHVTDSYDSSHAHSEQSPADVFSPQAPPVHQNVFNSPLCDRTQELADVQENDYSAPVPVAPSGPVFSHEQQVEPYQEPQHLVFPDAESSLWSPPTPTSHPPAYVTQPVVEQQSPPQQELKKLQSPQLLSSDSFNQCSLSAVLPTQQSVVSQTQIIPTEDRLYNSPVQPPIPEERFSSGHSPVRQTMRPDIQTPLIDPEPIPRLSQPHRVSRASPSSSPGAPASLIASRRRERAPSRSRSACSTDQDEPLPQAPVVPSQSHLISRHDRKDPAQPQTFRPFHPYPSHERSELSPRIHYHDGLAGGCIPPLPVFGLFGSYPLSRGPREQPLPGPTCAPATSSSVMRLVLTPPFRRPPPSPPPAAPPLPVRRPRMACYFCRKRKIACGPGPVPPPRTSQGGKDMSPCDDDGPCNQCARRGLDCERPTESKRGVRKSKSKGKEGEEDGDDAKKLPSGSLVTLELSRRPRPDESAEDEDDEDESMDISMRSPTTAPDLHL